MPVVTEVYSAICTVGALIRQAAPLKTKAVCFETEVNYPVFLGCRKDTDVSSKPCECFMAVQTEGPLVQKSDPLDNRAV